MGYLRLEIRVWGWILTFNIFMCIKSSVPKVIANLAICFKNLVKTSLIYFGEKIKWIIIKKRLGQILNRYCAFDFKT